MNKDNKVRNKQQVANSTAADSSAELESMLSDNVPINIYEFAKGRVQNSKADIKSATSIIGVQSQKETEQLWQDRLKTLANAEKTLNNVIRFKKLTAISLIASVALLIFSTYFTPTLPPFVFYGIILVAASALATYPAWFLAAKSAQNQRDSISRMFYKSNHEVELANGDLTLVNRANYADVTKIRVLDSNIGQLAT